MALRCPPAVVPKGRNETMLREYRLLAALAGTDVPHARAIAGCDDPSVIGGCFYLMDFVDGWSPIQEGTTWPAPFDADLGARRGLAFELVDGIAKLSKVTGRPGASRGSAAPRASTSARSTVGWPTWPTSSSGRSRASRRRRPGSGTHKPRTYVPGIMHGDYQFANVMYRHGAPARLAAIVDWEMATVGDPCWTWAG